MARKLFQVNSNTNIAVQELSQLESIKDLIENNNNILKVYAEIIQSIYDFKPELLEGEVFIETLSVKMLLCSRSILKLSKGDYLSTTKIQGTHKLVDFASINILTRSIIEAFLTLEYLFYNDLDHDEKLFRFNIWKISGYKSRQSFFEQRNNVDQNMTDKLNYEFVEINNLLKIIEQSPYYKTLNKNSLWKLDKYGLPRLKSWGELLENSTLRTDLFSIPYKLYSNYAHSEFISLIQMNVENTLSKKSKDNELSLLNSLRTVMMINCVSIILLKKKFKCTSMAYDELNDSLKDKIEFWNKFSVTTHISI